MTLFFRQVVLMALMTFCVGLVSASELAHRSLGIGLNGVKHWSNAHPFLDLMKQSGQWQSWIGDRDPDFILDADGWVKELKKGQTASLPFQRINKGYEPAYRRYVFAYEGDGDIRFLLATKRVEKFADNKFLIELGDGLNAFEIRATDPKNYIRNIRIVPQEQYANYMAGEVFNPKWLKVIEPFGAYRFMDFLKVNNAKQSQWRDRPKLNDRSWAEKGVPLEIISVLTAKMGVPAWINMPHLVGDDYFRSAAKLMLETYPKKIPLIVEFSNEVWNSQFKQARYARKMEKRQIGEVTASKGMQWYGSRVQAMCEVFKEVVRSSPVYCVSAIHTAVKGREKFALDCPDYKKLGYSGCAKNIDWLAVTTYFTGELSGHDVSSDKHKSVLKLWANSGLDGLDQGFKQLFTGVPLQNIEGAQEYRGVPIKLREQTRYWSKAAKSRGMKLVAYEGGQHLTPGRVFSGNSQIMNYYNRLNLDSRMGSLYREIFDLWREEGGALAMYYLEMSAPSKFGNFGAKNDYSDKHYPRWQALKEYSESVPCWWEGCVTPISLGSKVDDKRPEVPEL